MARIFVITRTKEKERLKLLALKNKIHQPSIELREEGSFSDTSETSGLDDDEKTHHLKICTLVLKINKTVLSDLT